MCRMMKVFAEDKFLEVLQSYVKQFANKCAATEDLLEVGDRVLANHQFEYLKDNHIKFSEYMLPWIS